MVLHIPYLLKGLLGFAGYGIKKGKMELRGMNPDLH